MAKKDFDEYYAKITSQYLKLLEALKEADELASKNAIDPVVIDNLTATIGPVKDSYMFVSYVKFLLDLPKDKNTKKRNFKQFKQELEKVDESKRGKEIIKKNDITIYKVKSFIDEELR